MSEATSSHRLPYGVAPPTFRLPDASHVGRSDLGRFASHLASSGLRPGMADHSVSEALYLWDPDGLGIEIYADRPARWLAAAQPRARDESEVLLDARLELRQVAFPVVGRLGKCRERALQAARCVQRLNVGLRCVVLTT